MSVYKSSVVIVMRVLLVVLFGVVNIFGTTATSILESPSETSELMTYDNTEFGIHFSYPSTWEKTSEIDTGRGIYIEFLDGEAKFIIAIYDFDSRQFTTLRELVDYSLEDNPLNTNLLVDQPMILGEVNGFELISQANENYIFADYFKRGDYVYVLNYLNSTLPTYPEGLNTVLNSFNWTEISYKGAISHFPLYDPEQPGSSILAAPSLSFPFRGTWRITSGYYTDSPYPHTNDQYNRYALDFVNASGETLGQPIYAAHSGVVYDLPYQPSGCGYFVKLRYGGDTTYTSYYCHLSSFNVAVNQTVNQNTVIGFAGSTGGSTGPHLHFAYLQNAYSIKPEPMSGFTNFKYGNSFTYTGANPVCPAGTTSQVHVCEPALTPPSNNNVCQSFWYEFSGFNGFKAYLTANAYDSSTSSNVGVWRPNILQAGKYKVEAWLASHGNIDRNCGWASDTVSADTSSARYDIYYYNRGSNPPTRAVINQLPLANEFVNLGSHNFNAGTESSVLLTDITGETRSTRNVSFSAMRFTLEQAVYTLSTSVSPASSGSVSISPTNSTGWSSGMFFNGTSVTVSATPAPGYHFVSWSGAASGSSPSTTVTMSSNKSVVANFAPDCYMLSKAVNPSTAGTIDASPANSTGCSTGQYTLGTVVSLTASPTAGNVFTNWSGDASGTAPSTTITMTGNKTVTANFNEICYSLTTSIQPEGSGAISANPLNSSTCSTGQYTAGTVVSLSASPISGYKFSNWGGDASGTSTETTVTISKNTSVSAAFSPECYQVSIEVIPPDGGTVTTNPPSAPSCPAGEFEFGTDVTLTASPASGYLFSDWSGDAYGTLLNTTISIDGQKNITATFVFPQYNTDWIPEGVFTGETTTSVGQIRKFLQSQGSCLASEIEDADGVLIDVPTLIHDAAVTYQINPKVILATIQKEQSAITTCPSKTKLAWLMGAGSSSTARAQINFGTSLLRAYLNELDSTGQTRSGWKVNVAKTTQDNVSVIPASKPVAALFTYTPYAGEKWGGNQPGIGGVQLFASTWDMFGFSEPFPPFVCHPLSVMASPDNSGTVNILTTPTQDCGIKQFAPGTTVQLSAAPATGYKFTSWSGDASGTTALTSLVMDGPKTAVANFETECRTLTIQNNPINGGSVSVVTSPNCGGTGYTHGTAVTIVASPATGYQFTSWGGDAAGTSPSAIVTMDGNKSVIANYSSTTPGTSPVLSIAQDVLGYPNGVVSFPITFTGATDNISAVAFSIDYDQNCLDLDLSDADADGVPDSISFYAPLAFSPSVMVDKNDATGELDFVISDYTIPFSKLPDGRLVSIDFNVICAPGIGEAQIASVNFSQTPAASFGSDQGKSIPGQTINGYARILGGRPGDVNGDTVIDAGDISALVLEIFDGDGNLASNAPGGTFIGNPVGSDPNKDSFVDAGDISCLVLTIFNGEGACSAGN